MKKLLMSLSMALIVVMMTVLSVQPLIAKSIATSDDSSSENGLENNLQKVYCEATIQDHFSDNEIIIVTMPFANFKKYTAEDFSEIGCVSVSEMSSDVKQDALSRIILLTIEGDSKQAVLDCIQKLQDREDIYSAEPNYSARPDATPNDTYYNIQWGPEKISLPATWNITTGSTSVLVGVIDSGIDGTHPDLIGNIDTNLSRCFSSAYTNALQDEDGHGTHVAGIIGAVGNNGIGIARTC